MKTKYFIYIAIVVGVLSGCDKIGITSVKLGGDPSAMGKEGVTVSSTLSVVGGVSGFSGIVTDVEGDISTYSGQATVTNPALRNAFANIPEVTIDGDIVKTKNIKFRQSTNGIELMSGPTSGVIVKYNSKVGDKYPVGNTGDYRTVVSKSTTDDYPYGFFNIKVIEVEEIPNSFKSVGTTGVTKITYWANHRFGLVGVKFFYDDGTSSDFPIYTSAEN